MEAASKTLFIPLYSKAYVSSRGLILHDPKAEEIWEQEQVQLDRKARSRMIAYYSAMRVAVFDRWVQRKLLQHPDALVVQIGCGMDTRQSRIGRAATNWIDVDLPAVIEQRKRYFSESDQYTMMAADAATTEWVDDLPDAHTVIVILEAVFMYIPRTEFERLGIALAKKFEHVEMVLDTYSEGLVKMSNRYAAHPVRQLGATLENGMSNPEVLGERIGIPFRRIIEMVPPKLVKQLPFLDRLAFTTLFTLNFSKRLYRMYEFSK